MKNWICRTCHTEVMASEEPNICWTDDHVCEWILRSEFGALVEAKRDAEDEAADEDDSWVEWDDEDDEDDSWIEDDWEVE
jgi:hypothetical protein